MATKSAFISFDFDHDNSLRGDLVAQAERPDSPFSITDWSVRYRLDEAWKKEVRGRIDRADPYDRDLWGAYAPSQGGGGGSDYGAADWETLLPAEGPQGQNVHAPEVST